MAGGTRSLAWKSRETHHGQARILEISIIRVDRDADVLNAFVVLLEANTLGSRRDGGAGVKFRPCEIDFGFVSKDLPFLAIQV